MKKIISYSVVGICTAAILSLLLTLIFGLFKLLDAAGVCFLIFLILACCIICTTLFIAIILLYKSLRKDGLKTTAKPILYDYISYSIIFMILTRLFYKEWLVWESLFAGIVFSLMSLAIESIKKK